MYGIIKGVSKETSPDVKMEHLASVVAIKIKNTTGGSIIINDIEFSVPRILEKDPITQKRTLVQEAFPIIGDCVVDLTGNKVGVTTATNSSEVYSYTKATLDKAVTLPDKDNNNELIVYLAVSPFETNGKRISIKVNGSARTTVKMTSNVLQPGKVTTFKVDVKPFLNNATEGLVSNAVDIKSYGEHEGVNWVEEETNDKSGFLDISYNIWYNYYIDDTKPADNTHAECNVLSFDKNVVEKTSYTINGKACSTAYVVGSEGEGTITFSGWAKDMLNALPISFYASGLDNSPTAMTIKSVNLWIPEYNIRRENRHSFDSAKETIEYQNLITRTQLKNTSIGSLINMLSDVMNVAVTENGLEREYGQLC